MKCTPDDRKDIGIYEAHAFRRESLTVIWKHLL
mgnify:CR=1 FL=1|uniref:Uncharacterized protein n=1 Tax=Siphoviridae sp. ctmP19 TaxID=2825651 RepID=A0A8S5PJ12_9CAUD|nr:MAG TPA: hypothetical protein [Siphoviridae sp. ctmP19]